MKLKRKKERKPRPQKEAFLRFTALSAMVAGSDKRLSERKETSRLLDPRYWSWSNKVLLRVLKKDVKAFLVEMKAAKRIHDAGDPEAAPADELPTVSDDGADESVIEVSGPPAAAPPEAAPGEADGSES